MSLRTFSGLVALAGLTAVAASSALAQITIPTVKVKDPGNVADPVTTVGSVAYVYNIGTSEVTAGQYAAFLNAVAHTDTFNLYNEFMERADASSGIVRTGVSGSYTYSVNPAYIARPVNYVSFWDACRFVNWLHNGQPNGVQDASTTEDGVYTMTPAAIAANTVARNPGWTWAIADQDEWHKAAYYKGGGSTAGYWVYPTRSDSVPGGDLADASGNNANMLSPGTPLPIQFPYYTTVAGQFANSPGPYGTFDQGGNVREWTERISAGAFRVIRGGSFLQDSVELQSIQFIGAGPGAEDMTIGFRVVQAPPPVSPNIIIDNLTEPQRGVSILGTVAPDDIWAAQGFTVPSSYALESITLILGESAAGNDPVAELRVGDLPDGLVVANLPIPALNPLAVEPVQLTPDVPVTLLPGQKYWLVLRTASTESFGWAYASGNFWEGPGSLVEYRYSEDQGVSWAPPGTDNPYLVLIRGTLICAADFNADGFLTFEDFDAFVSAFEGGSATADFNADGFLTFEDFDAFVAAFEAGC
ncbi:MAG: choice-of-anchor R domain-containing protein [Planctomycetota bacterium]|nr:choice-of-anchor R domain-containing protein [Planctomycetota bacterium]